MREKKLPAKIIVLCLTFTLILIQSTSCERNVFPHQEERKVPESTLFGYNDWREKIEGPISRFHHNFNLFERYGTWKLIRKEILPSTEAREVEYRYVNKNRQGSHLRVSVAECESITDAHEFIYSSLSNVMNPNPPLERPDGWNFGDVYKLGYWARDNVFVHTQDLSDPPLTENDMKDFNEAIDNELLAVPELAPDTAIDRPVIYQFSAAEKELKIGTTVQLQIKVDQPESSKGKLQYKIFVEGGRIFRANDIYYYAAEKDGKHRLTLYVTNSGGLTSKNNLVLTVIQ